VNRMLTLHEHLLVLLIDVDLGRVDKLVSDEKIDLVLQEVVLVGKTHEDDTFFHLLHIAVEAAEKQHFVTTDRETSDVAQSLLKLDITEQSPVAHRAL